MYSIRNRDYDHPILISIIIIIIAILFLPYTGFTLPKKIL